MPRRPAGWPRRSARRVAEVGAAVAREGIDCDWVHGGSLTVAQSRPQRDRLRARARRRAAEVGEGCATRLLDARRARQRGSRSRRTRSAVHPALRPGPAGATRRRAGRGRRARRSEDLRGQPGDRRVDGAARRPAHRSAARPRRADVHRAGHRGLHRGSARTTGDAAAAQQRDDRDRAAARTPTWETIGWAAPRRCSTALTSTPTRSAPRTGGSRSAGAGCPTDSAPAPSGRARCRRRPSPSCARRLAELLEPAAAGVAGGAGMARRARRRPRLVPGGRHRAAHRHRLRRGLCRGGVAASNLAGAHAA